MRIFDELAKSRLDRHKGQTVLLGKVFGVRWCKRRRQVVQAKAHRVRPSKIPFQK